MVRHPRVPNRISPTDVVNAPSPVLIVDSRTPPQFHEARIPGAVNIPITAAQRRNQQKLANVPAETRVVIYCNSASCSWAEAMAKSSLFQTFHSVSVLDDGLAGYEAAGGKLAFGTPQPGEAR